MKKTKVDGIFSAIYNALESLYDVIFFSFSMEK